jgi:hypothetical protein
MDLLGELMQLFLLFILFTTTAFSADWDVMHPLIHCSEVKLEYQKENESNNILYKVRIPKRASNQFFIETKLTDLNDLSVLTEILNEASLEFCPDKVAELFFDFGSTTCNENNREYTGQFINLFRDISLVVKDEKDIICNNIIPFIKLQSEIDELTENDFVIPKKTKKIQGLLFKLLTGPDTDKMIDHFYTCGGKKGSENFVKNLILLNVKDACLAPKPPGSLTWKEAEEIAIDVSKNYKNLSLIKLQKRQDQITQDAVAKFADKITMDQLSGLLGPFLEENENKDQVIKEFYTNLDSYKELKSTKTKDISNYVSFVYSVDTPIEVGEKAFPILLNDAFGKKMPEGWSQEKKESLIKETLSPIAQDAYNECLREEKDYAGIDREFNSVEEKIDFRLKVKERYCLQNPDQCNRDDCTGSLNMLSSERGSSDTKKIQGCVIRGLTVGIKPFLEMMIEEQEEAFQGDFKLTRKMVDGLTDKAWGQLLSCTNKEVALLNNASNEIDILKEKKWLENISTDKYQSIITKCSTKTESLIALDFVDQILLNNPILIETFEEGTTTLDEWGNTHDIEVLSKAKEITLESFVPCMDIQPVDNKDPLLCTPIVEMNATLNVIEKELEGLNGYNSSELSLEQKSFRACGKEALNSALNDIGNTQSSTPIITGADAKSYLNKNTNVLKCVQQTITNSSFIVAGIEYDRIYEEQRNNVKNKKFLKAQRAVVQDTIRDCFEKRINSIPDWKGFLEFNEKDGINVLKEECQTVATGKALSNIVINEAISSLENLPKTGFFKSRTEIFNTLAQKATELRLKHNIKLPEGLPIDERTHYSFDQALQAHLNSGKDIESFVSDVQKDLETITIKTVHNNLTEKIDNKDFEKSFTSSCLKDLYKLNDNNSSGNSLTADLRLETLADYLKVGLDFSKNSNKTQYNSEISKLQKECSNMSQYSSSKDFQKSAFYEIIIKGQIASQFKADFKDGILKDLNSKIENFIDPHKDIKLIYGKKMKAEMTSLLDRYMEDKKINEYLFNDSSVMAYATDNLDLLLSKDKNTLKGLSEKLISKMFEEKSGESFSDEFARIQVVGNFGISGIEKTFDQAKEGTSLLWGAVTVGESAGAKAATKFFKDPKNLEEVIGWDTIPKTKRRKITLSILNDAILEANSKRDTVPYSEIKFSSAIGETSKLAEYYKDIEEISSNLGNNYQNYDNKIYKEANLLTKELTSKYPALSFKFSEKQLRNTIIKQIKKVHMDQNVEGILMKHSFSDGNNIKERITEKVSKLGSQIWWGTK